MDRTSVSRPAQHTVQRIDFTHQMALAQTANRRIATHRADGIEVKADQASPRTHTRRRASRFDPGMTAADNKNIK